MRKLGKPIVVNMPSNTLITSGRTLPGASFNEKWERGENLLTQLIFPFSRKSPKRLLKTQPPFPPLFSITIPIKMSPLYLRIWSPFSSPSLEYALIHKSGTFLIVVPPPGI